MRFSTEELKRFQEWFQVGQPFSVGGDMRLYKKLLRLIDKKPLDKVVEVKECKIPVTRMRRDGSRLEWFLDNGGELNGY